MTTKTDRELTQLLRDFGYQVIRDAVYTRPIMAFEEPKRVRHCRNLFDAAEQMIPVVHSPEYHSRWTRITQDAR